MLAAAAARAAPKAALPAQCCALHALHTQRPPAGAPMGMTRCMYARADMLWLLTSPSTRTQRKPMVEQKIMCHAVRVIGWGKPENASSHCSSSSDLLGSGGAWGVHGWCPGRHAKGGGEVQSPQNHCVAQPHRCAGCILELMLGRTQGPLPKPGRNAGPWLDKVLFFK